MSTPATRRHRRLWLFCLLLTIGLLVAYLLAPQFAYRPQQTTDSTKQANSIAPISTDHTSQSLISVQLPSSLEPNTDAPRFVKINASGEPLLNDDNWSCVYDRHNSLLWEIKTQDGGWQDQESTFSWFKAATETEATEADTKQTRFGKPDGGLCYFISCDTQAYVDQANQIQLCGHSNWRLPSKSELMMLDHPTNFNPDIDTLYFPNTLAGYYWSATETPHNASIALAVDFHNTIAYATEKRIAYYIRIVSDHK